MTGVISHYATQRFLARERPPFCIPSLVRDKVRAVQATSQDGICETCRSIFQILPDKVDAQEEIEDYPHHSDITQLASSAALCPLCRLFFKVVQEDLPQTLNQALIGRPLIIGAVEEKLDTTVAPLAKAIVRFSYTGPHDALSNRYFQIEFGEGWTNSFPGRSIAPHIPWNLVSDWLVQCSSSHPDCVRISARDLPTRIIDVAPHDRAHPQLVQCNASSDPKRGRYLALSHCWGIPPPCLVTTKGNLTDHLNAIPYDKLSRNFQDAITATRELGFHYLWIDSLCIVQDDPDDWRKECSRMEAVYANAAMTLSASSAENSHVGFLNPRPPQESCSITIQHRDGDPITLQIARFPNGQSCVASHNKAVLDSRAWVLQERLLSHRILSFSDQQLHFECCTAQFCESIRFPLQPHGERPGWLRNPREHALLKPELNQSEPPSPLKFYFTAGEYSFRFLTKAADKLPALAGIAKRFHTLTHDQYVAGLWRKDLLSGLLWTADWHDNHNRDSRARLVYDASALATLPPSWSWASCELPIKFNRTACSISLVDVLKCEAAVVGADAFGQVSGGLLDLRGWTVDCYADEIDYKPHWWGEDVRGDFNGRQDVLFARLFRDRPRDAVSPHELVTVITNDGPDDLVADTEQEQDREVLLMALETMGHSREISMKALDLCGNDIKLAISHLQSAGSELKTHASGQSSSPLQPCKPSPRTSRSGKMTCLVMSRSHPVSYTPGWDWCGLALLPVGNPSAKTYRRIGAIYSSRIHGGRYGKIDIDPEQSLAFIQHSPKRCIRIV